MDKHTERYLRERWNTALPGSGEWQLMKDLTSARAVEPEAGYFDFRGLCVGVKVVPQIMMQFEFRGQNLRRLDFSYSKFSCSFNNGIFEKIKFEKGTFDTCRFASSQFRECDFQEATLVSP